MDVLQFTEKNVKLNYEISDWEGAVRKGIGILYDNGLVNEHYGDKVINDIKELGPYMIIHPGLAIPHTRPENGALDVGFSVLTLKKPVYFEGNDHPVHVLICFSATDNEKHLDIIKMIVRMVENGIIEKLSDVNSVNMLNGLIKEGEIC